MWLLIFIFEPTISHSFKSMTKYFIQFPWNYFHIYWHLDSLDFQFCLEASWQEIDEYFVHFLHWVNKASSFASSFFLPNFCHAVGSRNDNVCLHIFMTAGSFSSEATWCKRDKRLQIDRTFNWAHSVGPCLLILSEEYMFEVEVENTI